MSTYPTMQQKAADGFRLSPQQARVWSLQQFSEGAVCKAWCVLSVEGELDTKVLRQVIEEVIGRYEILRTTFSAFAGMKMPLQVVGATAEVGHRDHGWQSLN